MKLSTVIWDTIGIMFLIFIFYYACYLITENEQHERQEVFTISKADKRDRQ